MNRRSFIETLLSSLSLPAAEQEALRVLACSERTAFPKTLFSRGLLTPEGLRRAYETLLSIPSFRRDAAEVRPVPPDILPLPFLRARMVVPVSLSDGTLVVAMADPLDVDAREAIAKVTGRRVAVQVGTEEEIREAIEKAYGEGSSSMERLVEQVGEEGGERSEGDERVERLIGAASEAPIIRLVNYIIARGIERGASDIHLEPYEKAVRVRYRIDGILEEVEAPPKRLQTATFSSTAGMSVFSPLDLYLMGMIPKEQVPPMLLIDNTAVDPTQLPQPGATVTGTAKTVTIYDIIAAEGERIPNAAASQKQFSTGFVLLVRPGDNTAQALPAIETLRKAFAGRFAELTQAKGSIGGVAPELILRIDTPADGATVTGPDVTVTGTVINTTGAETGITIDGVPATVFGSRFLLHHVPLQEGANTLTVTATDNIALTATATVNVTASGGHYLRIGTNVESGLAPLDVAFRLRGSFRIDSPTVMVTGPVPVSLVATPGAASSIFN